MVHMFRPLFIRSWCICLFYEWLNHLWRVLTTFISQRVRISISWATQSWLNMFSSIFNSQEVCNSISWAAPSRLTSSCHFPFSVCAYLKSISSTITVNMLPLLSIIRKCVSPFHELAPSRLTCSHHFWLSAGAYIHFMSRIIIPWHVLVIFDNQQVRISIS